MRIVGWSMSPTLRPGDVVFVKPSTGRHVFRRGELVAVRSTDADGKTLIKRLAALPHERIDVEGRRWQLGEDQFFLLGDHPASQDSRAFGPVSRHELVGLVRLRLWPWTRF